MALVRIEPEPPIKEGPCDLCGGTTRLLHGYVYEVDQPRGIYFLEWCDGNHQRRAAFLTLGLGSFEEQSSADDRRAFCIEWHAGGMSLTKEAARDRPDLLGAFVPRDEALKMPHIDQVWHVCDHVISDDPRVASVSGWLDASTD